MKHQEQIIEAIECLSDSIYKCIELIDVISAGSYASGIYSATAYLDKVSELIEELKKEIKHG